MTGTDSLTVFYHTWVTFTMNIRERGRVAMIRRMEHRVSRREQRPTLFSHNAEIK